MALRSGGGSPIGVVDGRRTGVFIVEDAAVDSMASVVGTNALAVYVVLCRHASRDGVCYPSADTIGAKLGMSRSTVWRAVALLERHRMVGRSKRQPHGRTGTFLNNEYRLLGRKLWIR